MNLRKQKAMQTKKKILETALEMFNEKGFNNVTVDAIVEKTSTSKGAFYNHFSSKHDIFLEKFKEIDDYYVQELYPSLERYKSVVEKLTHFFSMQMTYIQNDLGWDVIRTIYEQELNTERESFFLNPDRPLYHFLDNLCEEGQNSGEFRNDITPQKMTTIIVRVMRGILYDWNINKGNYSLKDEQKLLFGIMLEGLKNQHTVE